MQTRRVTVRGIIVKDDKIFAQKLKTNDGRESDYWCIAGGGLDPGESLHDGLRREMVEETGVAPEIGRLLYIQQYAHNDREFLEFFFHITNADDYETIDLAATSHGEAEVARCGFVTPNVENVLPKFLQHRDIATDLAKVTPVAIVDNLNVSK